MTATRSNRRRALTLGRAVVVLVASLVVTGAAHAEDTDPTQRENAQALYKAGNDARDAGDMKGAAANYKIAYALVQTPVIAVALGKAQVALGQLIEGRQTLLSVIKIPLKPSESVLTTSARADAAALASEIEARIPAVTLKINVPEGQKAPTVTVDGVTIPEVGLNAPWKLNPGHHLVVATVADAKTEAQFTVAEAEVRDLELAFPTQTTAEVPAPPLVSAKRVTNSSKVPAYVALGVGGAGVVVTVVFGVVALHDKSALNSACTAGKMDCPSTAESDITGMHATSIASDVGLGVAAVGLGVGGALLLFGHRSQAANPASERAAARVTPWVGARALGITGSFQ
jgi:hypothetical protein